MNSGAIAPTFALSLFALVAVGGIAFDYARLAAMDTELQNAADQAALAAATQLDGLENATLRAENAALTLVQNNTKFANDDVDADVDDSSFDVTVAEVKFFSDRAMTDEVVRNDANPDDDAAARFVAVTVGSRTAEYALTPIVGAISGDSEASAAAGLGSAICKVPPVMICNPDEPVGNTDPDLDFDAAGRKGFGLKLVSVGNGGGDWAPGNFGYLDVGSPTANPNVELREALGWLSAPGDCSSLGGVRTRTGAGTSVTPAINTRFDIYEKVTGGAVADSCPGTGSCPASINSVKDLVRKPPPPGGIDDKKCGIKNNEWEAPSKPYLPTSGSASAELAASNIPNAMGHPRDKCHSVTSGMPGYCAAKIGNGTWDRNAYFKVNYDWSSTEWDDNIATGDAAITWANPTRYDVYKWEIANRDDLIDGTTILAPRTVGSNMDYDKPMCSPVQGYGSGIVPDDETVDRRRISAAVINCDAHNVHGGGGTIYPVIKWIELFLVEPSYNRARTDANDVYVEIIGETELGEGATAGQVTRRDVPYLIT